MSDSSENNKELDQYGVWVKTPPHDDETEEFLPLNDGSGDSEKEVASSDFSFLDGLSSEDDEKLEDDFSDFQISDDTNDNSEVSTEEAVQPTDVKSEQDIEDNSVEIPVKEIDSPADESGDQAVSLDEFFSDDTSSENTSNSSEDSHPDDGEISLDEFFDTDSSLSDKNESLGADTIQNEEPLDIDLEFDDTVEVKMEDTGDSDDFSLADIPDDGTPASASSDNTESINLSDFFNDDPPSDSPAEPSVSKVLTPESSSESVDVDNFDNVFDSLQDSNPSPRDTSTVENSEPTETEEVDLSEFGLDSDDESSPAEASEEAEEAQKDIKTNFDISVSADDGGDDESIADTGASDATEESVSLVQDGKTEPRKTEEVQSASSDSDFDVDSLLDSIEDENGQSVSLGDAPAESTKSAPKAVVEETPAVEPVESIMEEKNEEPAEDASAELEEIPDSFDEEINSLTEPVDSNEEIDIPVVAPIREAAEEPIETTDEQPSEDKEDMDNSATDILKQIAAEIQNLRREITGLKTDVENIKNKATLSASEPKSVAAAPLTEEPVAEDSASAEELPDVDESAAEEEEEVALSGDELGNILGSADFAEEAPASEEPIERTIDTTLDEPEETPFTEEESQPSEEVPEEPAEQAVAAEEPEEVVFEEPMPIDSSSADEFVDETRDLETDVDVPEVLESVQEPEVIEPDFAEPEEEVALSGDELGNILGSADFAEEDTATEEPIEKSAETEDVETDDSAAIETTEEVPAAEPLEESPVEELEELPVLEEIVPDEEPSAQEEEEVALSGDELGNILGSADFAEASTAETTDIQLSDDNIEYLTSEEPIEEIDDTWNAEDLAKTATVLDDTEEEEPAVISGVTSVTEESTADDDDDSDSFIPDNMRSEIKAVLSYMDQLLESLPEEKIAEFAKSEEFNTYKKLFKELGLA